jgi:hypothetical protein
VGLGADPATAVAEEQPFRVGHVFVIAAGDLVIGPANVLG